MCLRAGYIQYCFTNAPAARDADGSRDRRRNRRHRAGSSIDPSQPPIRRSSGKPDRFQSAIILGAVARRSTGRLTIFQMQS